MSETQSTTTEPAGPGVRNRLDRAWRRQRWFIWARGGCHLLLWAAALFALDLVTDWLFVLSPGGRIALLAMNAVILLAVFYSQWWSRLQRFDASRVALQVERLHPELQSILISYVQSENTSWEYASPALVRAMQHKALAQTRTLDFGKIVRFGKLKKIGLACLAVAVVLTAAGLSGREFLRVFFVRMADPHSSPAYPTLTTIKSVTGNRVVQQGKPLVLVAIAAGRIPDEAELRVRPGEELWETIPVPRGKHTEFLHKFDEVFASFSYSFRVGDAASDVYRVTVVPPPRIEPRVILTYPAYTRLGSKELDTLGFEVPEGTQIEWQLKSDLALASGKLVGNDQTREFSLSPDGRTASLRLTAAKSFFYRFGWVDRANGFVTDEQVRYFVRVVPDAVPQVTLTAPAEDEKATVVRTLDLAFTAQDDYGLGEAWIVYSVNGGEEQKQYIGEFGDHPRRMDGFAQWPIRATVAQVKEGDLITYAVQVSDTRQPSPNLARSHPRRLAIVSRAEYLAFVLDKKKGLFLRIKELYAQEKEAGAVVGEMRKVKTGAPEEKVP